MLRGCSRPRGEDQGERESAILHVGCLKWWLPPFFFPFLLPFQHACTRGEGRERGRGPLRARVTGTGAKMELEGEIKGGEEGERERMRFASTRPIRCWLLCILRKGEAGRHRRGGKNGGKEGGKKKKEHLGEDGEGQGCARGAGKNLPFFLRRPPFALPAILL